MTKASRSTPALVVAWRKGRRLLAGRINITDDVAAHLRAVADKADAEVAQREPKPYSVDAQLEPEERFVVPESPVTADNQLTRLLRTSSQLPLLDATKLPPKLLLHATLVGDMPDALTAYVRKRDALVAAEPGKMLTALRQSLTRIDEPAFVLDDKVDLIVRPNGVVDVLNQASFEVLYHDLDAVAHAVPGWVGEIASHLPLTNDCEKLMVDAAMRDSRVRRRILAIRERGHLEKVSIEGVQEEADRQGVDLSAVITGEKLTATPETLPLLLRLLNEDLFTGGLSGSRFAAERKSSR